MSNLTHDEYIKRRNHVMKMVLSYTHAHETTLEEIQQAIDELVNEYSEVWLPIVGYEGKYEVSNLGRVRRTPTQKIMKLRINERGYYRVSLSLNNVSKSYFVQRLVATAFVPNYQDKKCVNHMDSNPLNNHWKNLEWVTYAENTRHGMEKGYIDLRQSHIRYKNARFNRAKLSEIFELSKQGAPSQKIADKYGVAYSTINEILKGRIYKYDTVELRASIVKEATNE